MYFAETTLLSSSAAKNFALSHSRASDSVVMDGRIFLSFSKANSRENILFNVFFTPCYARKLLRKLSEVEDCLGEDCVLLLLTDVYYNTLLETYPLKAMNNQLLRRAGSQSRTLCPAARSSGTTRKFAFFGNWAGPLSISFLCWDQFHHGRN